MSQPTQLSTNTAVAKPTVTFGVCAAGDPRIDQASRDRTANIVRIIADIIARDVRLPDGSATNVVYSTLLIDGETQADIVGRQFRDANVDAVVCTPDTWAFPQLSLMSLMAHLPKDTPLNITCGNSAPKPGVVFAHAVNGAFAQSGRLAALNVGSWPDEGQNPQPTPETITALVDWCYAALTYTGLKGRRIVIFGHDSMGMETALAHVPQTRNAFGLEITRLDMKLLSDLLNKKAYDAKELAALVKWVKDGIGDGIDLSRPNADAALEQSLAMYLIMRDLLNDYNAVGGGFMNQLEWGSDKRGICLPVCDMAESLFNSTFDHNGPKPALPFATEADVQGALTMLFFTWLSSGQPPLFMDFRKVWEPHELCRVAREVGVTPSDKDLWATRGIVDGDNSGSASLNWAGLPGDKPEDLLRRLYMPAAEPNYFPGGGNSVHFISPGGIEGIAGRMAYSTLSGMWSLVWDEACTVDLPEPLAQRIANFSNIEWPHTWVVPRYATMAEYKQYAPANHFHMTWNLPVARVQHWMDLTHTLSVNPWAARPAFIEGADRPIPLLYLLNGGENESKRLLARGK